MSLDFIPDKVKKLEVYYPIDHIYRVRLETNESFIELPTELKRKVSEIAVDTKFNRYPDPAARDVKEAFGKYIGVDPKYLTAGSGSDELISVIVNSLLEKGNKALTFTPDFSMYAFYCRLAEVECIRMKQPDDLILDIDEVIKKANEEKVNIIMFSNPCNPTAQGVSRTDVIKLIENVNAIVMLDEAYMDFWNQSLIPDFQKYNNLIILKTCSKFVGLAALRVGFAIANEDFTRVLNATRSPFNVNSLSQGIATEVLKNTEFLDECKAKIIESRDELHRSLKKIEKDYQNNIKVFDTKTNFVLVQTDLADTIFTKLHERDISIRRQGKNYLRITAGAPEENAEFICEFETILAEETAK